MQALVSDAAKFVVGILVETAGHNATIETDYSPENQSLTLVFNSIFQPKTTAFGYFVTRKILVLGQKVNLRIFVNLCRLECNLVDVILFLQLLQIGNFVFVVRKDKELQFDERSFVCR